MKHVYVFLADGFEEIEAVTPIDVLRRAEVTVHLVGVTGIAVRGAHGIEVEAELPGEGFALPADADMVLFPGGAGVEVLRKNMVVKQALCEAAARGIYIAAICAAPLLLQDSGLLQGKRVTAFPSVTAEITGAEITGAAAEWDGNIITGRSAGTALAFTSLVLEALQGKEAAQQVLHSLYPEH